MSTDPRDAALLTACPCQAIPRFGDLPAMPLGQRTLVARNGVFVQTRLDWLDCTLRIAELPPAPPLPYGEGRESIRLSFGVLPLALLGQFIDRGRAALPNEIAGGLIYSTVSKRVHLRVYEALEAGPAGVRYRMPELGSDERIAVDLHTHGVLPAFWSDVDDRDDAGVKICGVFGSLDRQVPTARFRLAVNGMFRDLADPWTADLAEPGADETLLAPR